MAVCVSYILNICECGKRVEKENKMRENTLKSFQAPSLFLFLPSPLPVTFSLVSPTKVRKMGNARGKSFFFFFSTRNFVPKSVIMAFSFVTDDCQGKSALGKSTAAKIINTYHINKLFKNTRDTFFMLCLTTSPYIRIQRTEQVGRNELLAEEKSICQLLCCRFVVISGNVWRFLCHVRHQGEIIKMFETPKTPSSSCHIVIRMNTQQSDSLSLSVCFRENLCDENYPKKKKKSFFEVFTRKMKIKVINKVLLFYVFILLFQLDDKQLEKTVKSRRLNRK